MGWTLEISGAAGDVTIDASHRFDIRAEKKLNERSLVEYVDVHIDIEGNVVESTPEAVADGTKALYDLVASRLRLAPVRFSIILDGETKWEFTPAASMAGPTVLDFNTIGGDGAGGSAWRYALSLFVRLPGNNFNGLQDLRTSLSVVTNVSGTVTRKVWEVTAKASTISQALAGVMKFKPTGKVSEEIRKDFDLLTVSAIWVWRLSSLTFTEQISITGGGASYVEDPQVGVNRKPLLHRARRHATVIQLDGVARGLETEGVAAPPAHWRESSELKRQTGLEVRSFPTVANEEDRELGIVTLPYSEIWIFTGERLPPPDHGSHGVQKKKETAPSDGIINR